MIFWDLRCSNPKMRLPWFGAGIGQLLVDTNLKTATIIIIVVLYLLAEL